MYMVCQPHTPLLIYLYSEGGEKRTVDCDTVQEFMNVLNFVRATAGEDMISYAEPL